MIGFLSERIGCCSPLSDTKVLAGVGRIALSCSPNLGQFGIIGKPEATQGRLTGGRGGPTPRRAPRNVAFPVIKARLSRGLQRTHDNRAPYADDATGGGAAIEAILRPVLGKDALLVTDGCTSYPACAVALGVSHEALNQTAGEGARHSTSRRSTAAMSASRTFSAATAESPPNISTATCGGITSPSSLALLHPARSSPQLREC